MEALIVPCALKAKRGLLLSSILKTFIPSFSEMGVQDPLD